MKRTEPTGVGMGLPATLVWAALAVLLVTNSPAWGLSSDDLTIVEILPPDGGTLQGPSNAGQWTVGGYIGIKYEYELHSRDSAEIFQRALLQDGSEAYNQYWTFSPAAKGKSIRINKLTILCKAANQADTRIKAIRYKLADGNELLVQKTASVDYTFTCPKRAAGLQSVPAQAAQADPKALKVMSPDLSVKSIAVHPVPLKAGTSVNIEIAFENKGNKASAPDAKYKLTCAVLQGGPECPVPSGDRTIGKGIDPGQTGSVLLMGAKPAVAGEYLVSVAVPPDQMGRPYSVTLKVAPVVTGPRTQPPDKPPQVRPTPPSQPPADDSKPKPRLVPR